MSWWLCAAAKQLREQINARFPHRDKRSDGSVGDLAHAIRKSDHNPDPTSAPPMVVRAIDIDEDLTTLDDSLANRLAEGLREMGPHDARLSYVIFEGAIASRAKGWEWRPYNGANAHKTHLHVSFTRKGDHDATPFALPVLERST